MLRKNPEKLIILPQSKHVKLFFFCLLTIIAIFLTSLARAQEGEVNRVLMPLGNEHSVTLTSFIDLAITRSQNQSVNILILPVGFSSDPNSITNAERSRNLNNAGSFRTQIEQECNQSVPDGITCNVSLAPILTRSDATQQAQEYFRDDLAAILILDGDPTIARRVIAGTPLEQSLNEAYHNGVAIAAAGDVGNALSLAMLAGYNPGYSANNSLDFASSEVWNDAEKHGLLLGVQNTIIEQNIFSDNRMGRLLNAITQPESPHIGIGIDANAALNITGGTNLVNISGENPITILDAETYHAAQSVHYRGPEDTLSLRNVLVHLLAPGSSYNLESRQSSLAPSATQISRTFDDSLTLPSGSGTLMIAGDLSDSLEHSPILERFVGLTNNDDGDILIIATGYDSEHIAEIDSRLYAEALGAPSHTIIVPADSTSLIHLPTDVSGILLIGADQSKTNPGMLSAIKDVWLTGKPLLADNAGAAIVGEFYSAHPPTPSNKKDNDIAIQESFLPDQVSLNPGLGLLNLTIEPKLLSDKRWNYLISISYNMPHLLSLGLTDNTALEITHDGATVMGQNTVLTLDMRNAALASGENGRLVVANGLLDVYSQGDYLKPENADIDIVLEGDPTPVLPSPTMAGFIIVTPTRSPTPPSTITPTTTPKPTKKPKRTATPLIIPPPADPGTSNLMILFGLLIAVVILIGIGFNYRRIFYQTNHYGDTK